MPIGVVVLALVGVGVIAAMLVPRALAARDDLQSAAPLVADVQAKMLAGDTAGATRSAAALAEATADARTQTNGRLWRAVEWVPTVGPNLEAVRVIAATVDSLAHEAVVPVASVSIDALKPVDGRIDLSAVTAAAATVEQAADALEAASGELASIDRAALIDEVDDGVDMLDAALDQAGAAIEPMRPLLGALPGMLGAEGPRDVLVLFQNNGEVMPGGGTVGSLAQLHIEDGAVSLVAQASAEPMSMPMYDEDVVPIAPDVRATYPFGLGRYVQSLTRTPRFSLTSEIAREMWRRTHGVEVDAVVALDTVALSYFLEATGPIDLPDGVQISSGNAVSLLLGDLYATYDPLEVDAINQAFAAATMSRLLSGTVDVGSLLSVVERASAEHRIRVWSAREGEQQLITGSPLQGEPPGDQPGVNGFGVYFIDYTPGKMQRYMTQHVDVSQATCPADGRRHVRVTVVLGNTVDPGALDDLPDYVSGGGGTTPVGDMRVEVLSYAPSGFGFVGQSTDGPNQGARSGTDGEFVVAQQLIRVSPQQARTVTFDYLAPNVAEATLVADVTPVVSPNVITTGRLDCAAVGAG
ncbi:DUF4012 domain-containing protein [Agromyces humi]|uniref:DUF4012 domain-containing protein n=1 Tax=Agromyces humi TaxID=1766800 RepID=UPI0013591390|nr:DUF4012 domain-containing protein [Agromyces humi]